MIRVISETRNNRIVSLEVTGHAGFMQKGHDIVCAAASLTGCGLLNAVDEMCSGQCELLMEDNRIYIKVLEDSDRLQTILNTGFIQYQTLSERFDRYVTTQKTEVKI